jgi:hypothetical protein
MEMETKELQSALSTGECSPQNAKIKSHDESTIQYLIFDCYSYIIQRYKTWVTNPKLAQEMAENVTRKTIGVKCCPVAGIPPPSEEEEELLEMTREIDLS